MLAGGGALLLGDEEHRGARRPRRGAPGGHRRRARLPRGPGRPWCCSPTARAVPDDVCFYPRSGKVVLRGLGVIGRLEQLDYWDGEE